MDKRVFKKLDVVKDQVISAYESGVSLAELSKIHTCSTSTVANFLQENNVPRRRRGPKNGPRKVKV